MAKLTTAEFIDAIKELSVLELNDLVKACEEELSAVTLASRARSIRRANSRAEGSLPSVSTAILWQR